PQWLEASWRGTGREPSNSSWQRRAPAPSSRPTQRSDFARRPRTLWILLAEETASPSSHLATCTSERGDDGSALRIILAFPPGESFVARWMPAKCTIPCSSAANPCRLL